MDSKDIVTTYKIIKSPDFIISFLVKQGLPASNLLDGFDFKKNKSKYSNLISNTNGGIIVFWGSSCIKNLVHFLLTYMTLIGKVEDHLFIDCLGPDEDWYGSTTTGKELDLMWDNIYKHLIIFNYDLNLVDDSKTLKYIVSALRKNRFAILSIPIESKLALSKASPTLKSYLKEFLIAGVNSD